MSGFHLYAAVSFYYVMKSCFDGEVGAALVCLAGYAAFMALAVSEESKK